jgi:hypothetical protein
MKQCLMARYLVPVKEQCGVKDPYVREFGQTRNYTLNDTCACNTAQGDAPPQQDVWYYYLE